MKHIEHIPHPIIKGIREQLFQLDDFEINPDHMKHIEHILSGKDVIIDASIYSEFGEYLFRYLNVALARGETALVVCPDEQEMVELHNYTKERLRIINSYHHIWKTDEYHYSLDGDDRDILFTTLEIVSNDNAFRERFFNTLSTVVITNALESMARDHLLLSLLSFKLVSLKKEQCSAVQYICLAESIPLDIRNALVNTLHLSEPLASRNMCHVHKNTKIMLWRYEDPAGSIAQNGLFESEFPRYLGLALPFSYLALKKGVDMVSIFSRIRTPHKQMLDNINTITHYLNPFCESTQIDFNKQVVFNRFNHGEKYTRFIVIDDELCNLPMALYSSARFGGKYTPMIHIISKAYMLRDFFFANAETYLNCESSINMFMPCAADTAKLAIFSILYEMQKNGLSEDEIIERVKTLQSANHSSDSADSPTIQEALAYCIEKATDNNVDGNIYHYFSFQKKWEFNAQKGDFDTYYLVKCHDEKVISDLMNERKLAVLSIGNQTFTTNFFDDCIYQHYLPKQYMVYNLRSYQITDIQNGKIYLKNGPDNCKIPTGYTQIRCYYVKSETPEIIDVQGCRYDSTVNNMVEEYTVQHIKVPMKVQTSGYYVHKWTGEAFNYLEPFRICGEQDDDMLQQAERIYSAANVLNLKIKCKITSDTDKASFLMAVIMSEFFKTWFPYSKDYIAVCPVLKNAEAICSDELGKHISQLYPQVKLPEKLLAEKASVELYIIEDSKTNLGIVQSLMDNWQNMFERIFENLREYLNWQQTYDDTDNANIHNKYLYFGKDDEPDCFHFKTLMHILNEISCERRVDTVYTIPVKKLLSEIASEIEKFNEDFTLTIKGLTKIDIRNVKFFIHFPELRKVHWSGTFYSDYAVIEMSIKISMEHKILLAYRSGNIELLSAEEQQVLDVALNVITSKISENLSDYEKELIVHDYIIMNCVYDSVNYNNNTVPDTSRTSYGALVLGVAVCEGYSRAFKLLLNMLNIECDYIAGLADGEYHAWNRVKIDGDYYLVDVTWDDPILKANSNTEAHYDFFNLTDEAMNASHTPNEPQIKVANSTKYNYFYYNKLVVSSKNDFLAILQNALDKGEKHVYVLYENIDLREFIESQDLFQYLGGKSKISYSFSDKVNTVYLQFE